MDTLTGLLSCVGDENKNLEEKFKILAPDLRQIVESALNVFLYMVKNLNTNSLQSFSTDKNVMQVKSTYMFYLYQFDCTEWCPLHHSSHLSKESVCDDYNCLSSISLMM